ncbi:hypothetical protein GCM10008018_54540 [Paenibacillus marchantiophytorum]|uniref:Uncharacterized protein n=1 Tax=Paenibacillus marchantiophytorum TaxID=1619310 RepID=A0ABQ1F6X5_9BACL|nr:hypothetical protein [Paenibacillus marchantiophytorum]GGA01277.1 hypothetical protein GCM10008018_54540 [Paenibacillus marchantiophytorum]
MTNKFELKDATEEVLKAVDDFRWKPEGLKKPAKITLNYRTYMRVAAYDQNSDRFEIIVPDKVRFMGINLECVPDQKENVLVT